MNNSEEKEIKSVTSPTNITEPKTEEIKSTETPKEDTVALKNLDKDFAYELMSIPSKSKHEYRMVSYIIMWARRHNIDYEFDKFGNLYLTKGTLSEGEFYPCVTSHMDTVQSKQEVYAKAGCNLEIKTRINKNGQHEMYVDGMGIGADCKSGIVISLSLVEHFDKIKACFFLQEELGLVGSKELNTDWFKDVGYVIGWDSPELNRAAYASSGTKLFGKEFFDNHIKDICAKHGLKYFNSEPITDVKCIREKTDIICMNFGNGGYYAHCETEYCILEEMDIALTMGIELIEHLAMGEFKLKHTSYSYYDEDDKYLRKFSKGYVEPTNYSYNTNYSYSSYTPPTTTQPSSTTTPKVNTVNEEVHKEAVKYLVEAYENSIKTMKSEIEKKCKENGIDKSIFDSVLNFSIKF